MIRIVVTGSECTGKTTLAEALAASLGVPCVPEYARQFVRDKGAPPESADVEAIARGQIAAEDAAMAQLARGSAGSRSLLLLDTDLLSTILYSHHYYGDCPAWIEAELERRRADLYLLAGIDVPWQPDGSQRDRGERREQMQALFATALRQRQLPFAPVTGTRSARISAALLALARQIDD